MVNNGDVFGLDARNGKLVVNDDLDFETTQSYTLKVSVSDGKLSSNADITVNVTDVNEEPTEPENTAPAISDQTFSVAEDAANGITVGTVQATDAENDNLTFSITSGNTGDAFAIAESTGAITVAGALDFETASTYTLKVSVSDGELSSNADITVNVTDVEEAAEPGDRLPAKDINALTAASLTFLNGLWSDGTTIWVVYDGFSDDKLYAYTLATGASNAAKDIDLAADNTDPIDIWSDETTIWIADESDAKLYAYTLATGTRDAAKEFDLAMDNTEPTGLWSNGTTIWVADLDDDKLYAYTLATGARDAAKEFDLAAVNVRPTGLWSDGTTMWVADLDDDELYAYTLATGTRDADRDILASDNVRPKGLWSDGTTIWVADQDGFSVGGDEKLYAYAIETTTPAPTPAPAPVPSPGDRLPVRDINDLAMSNRYPEGLWSNGTTIWVVDNSNFGGSDKLYAYTLATGARDANKDINTLTAAGNTNPRDLWSDGTTMWVADQRDAKIYAYTLATGVRDASKEFDGADDGADDNVSPTGLWSNGTTVWVADNLDPKLYAYTLATGARDTSKDINNLRTAGNTSPNGLWSDGTTIWVVDLDDDKLYAYTLATGARDAAKEFDLDAGNTSPNGLWSDGNTIWVTQEGFGGNDKLYAYQLK